MYHDPFLLYLACEVANRNRSIMVILGVILVPLSFLLLLTFVCEVILLIRFFKYFNFSRRMLKYNNLHKHFKSNQKHISCYFLFFLYLCRILEIHRNIWLFIYMCVFLLCTHFLFVFILKYINVLAVCRV